MKKRLLDLFCGAGGAAIGYARAGFEVVGVDINPQPNYPFEFHQSTWDEAVDEWVWFTADAIHASPPCQKYTSTRRLGKTAGDNAPDLIGPVRDRLNRIGLPYVIENVPGAPLLNPAGVCGSSFGLTVRRHRLFESNVPLHSSRCRHNGKTVGVYGDHPQISKGMNRAHTIDEARVAMGIDWMTWPEIREAIPPAYTEFIGLQLRLALMTAHAELAA